MIREFNKKDLGKILEIENECFSYPWNREIFESEVESGSEIFVLEEDDVIGYIDLHFIQDTIDLNNIAIMKSKQKKGYGQELLTFMFELAKQRKIKKIFLEVNPNIEAYYLYKKNGFEENRIRKNYYPDGDAIEMVKEIK